MKETKQLTLIKISDFLNLDFQDNQSAKQILTFYLLILFFNSGGHSTFFALLNTFVHIVMYFYYMVSAMGPDYQKYIWWKKYLTSLQMVIRFIYLFIYFLA